MSITQKQNGKYLVDLWDEYGTRIRRTFNTKMEAKAFESKYITTKYENKLIQNKIKKAKFSFEQAVNDFEYTKAGLRPKSYQKYKFVLNQLKLFAKALQIEFVNEFTPPQGNKLRERRLLVVCKEVAAKAKPESNAYLHKFRHTYATMLIRKRVSIGAIKELLGHWSVTETEIYAHNQADYLHNEVSKLDHLLTQ